MTPEWTASTTRPVGSGHGPRLERAAVDQQRRARATGNRGELVHDPARDAGRSLLRRRGRPRRARAARLPLRRRRRARARTPPRAPRSTRGRTRAGRRRRARASRPTGGRPRDSQLAHHAGDIASPAGPDAGGVGTPVRRQLDRLVRVERTDAHGRRRPRRDDARPVDRERQNEAFVVVRVIADQVDPARRAKPLGLTRPLELGHDPCGGRGRGVDHAASVTSSDPGRAAKIAA